MRSIGDRRGLWVFLFLISGLPALFSVLALLFNPVGAVPWVVLSWTVLVVSGYRIWRIDHPYRSARRQLARGGYLFVTFAAGLIGLLLVQAEPMLLVIGVAVWLGVMILLGLALWLAERGRTAP
jgi:hypothetical protein